jgi:hypothetical protein
MISDFSWVKNWGHLKLYMTSWLQIIIVIKIYILWNNIKNKFGGAKYIFASRDGILPQTKAASHLISAPFPFDK